MIVVDIETSGVDPRKHSILSIGAIDFKQPENQFYEECYIFEGAEISLEALAINGFTENEIKNPKKKSLEEIIKLFIEWITPIENKILAGHNTFFDLEFLRHSFLRYNIDWKLGHRIIDLHSICFAHCLQKNIPIPIKNGRTDLNLDKILNYVGLPDEPKPHNALTGAKLEAEALARLIYKKNILKEFASFSIPEYL
ncbi:MAG: ribonuclease T [Candidatus Parcubacteria bacterium]|nr:MAG: ribonuclease T [Candidatus Parcubacteria bacterium]